MRVAWLSVLVVLFAPMAAADPVPPVVQTAQQCLKDHADRIVADEPDLHSAASLLVEFVCANEVAAAARYERNYAIAGQYNSMMKTLGAAAAAHDAQVGAPTTPNWSDYLLSVDPVTGALVFPPPRSENENPGFWSLTSLSTAGAGAWLQLDPDPVPADLRALAGQLVLAAHERTSAHP